MKTVATEALVFGVRAEEAIDVVIETDSLGSFPVVTCIFEGRSGGVVWDGALSISNDIYKTIGGLVSEGLCEFREAHYIYCKCRYLISTLP